MSKDNVLINIPDKIKVTEYQRTYYNNDTETRISIEVKYDKDMSPTWRGTAFFDRLLKGKAATLARSCIKNRIKAWRHKVEWLREDADKLARDADKLEATLNELIGKGILPK